jgi:hypothetical protein
LIDLQLMHRRCSRLCGGSIFQLFLWYLLTQWFCFAQLMPSPHPQATRCLMAHGQLRPVERAQKRPAGEAARETPAVPSSLFQHHWSSDLSLAALATAKRLRRRREQSRLLEIGVRNRLKLKCPNVASL